MTKSWIVRVQGMVQGVGFRYSAMNRARSLGLKGWVRNEMDGSVTTRFEGEEADCEIFIQWLRQGPPSAVVNHVDVKELNPEGEFDRFTVVF